MSFLADIFSGGSKEPIPQRDDPEVREAKRRRAQALARSSGRASTILAGPGGVENEAFLARTVLGPGGTS